MGSRRGAGESWSQSDFATARHNFLREARELARVNHPGLPRVVETFEQNQTAYVVTEYIGGRSLHSLLLEKGTLPEWAALDLVRRVGQALQQVHPRGLLHGNVQPANIRITDEGRVVLVNFELSGRLISQHAVLLTPGYSAPEQWVEGEIQGAYTDVYGLAATLYHLLGGQAPPPTPDLRSLCHDVSLTMEAAVSHGLERSPEARPQAVEAFLAMFDSQEVPLLLSMWNQASLPTPQEEEYAPTKPAIPSPKFLRLVLILHGLSLGGFIPLISLLAKALIISIPLGPSGKVGARLPFLFSCGAIICWTGIFGRGMESVGWACWAASHLAWLAYLRQLCLSLDRPKLLVRLPVVLGLSLAAVPPLLLAHLFDEARHVQLLVLSMSLCVAALVFYWGLLFQLIRALSSVCASHPYSAPERAPKITHASANV